jgi:hypothetical protein
VHRRGGGVVVHQLRDADRDERDDAGGAQPGVVGRQVRRRRPPRGLLGQALKPRVISGPAGEHGLPVQQPAK